MKNWDEKWGGKNTRKRERERRACVRVRVRYRPGGRQCFDNGARLTESTARREASERWARVCTQVIETSGGEAPRARVIGNPLLRVAYERDPLGLNNLHGCAC